MTAKKLTKKPSYSLEFKQDAAKLVLEKGYSCQKAADHLGVSLSALSRWVKAERPENISEPFGKKTVLSLAEHDELRRLRKENEQLRMESYFQIWCMNVVKRLTDYYRVTRYHL